MTNLFIKEKHLKMLQDIFAEHIPTARVVAYGSRIQGGDNAHSGSDLDLAIVGLEDFFLYGELKESIQESNIPFLVEIFILNKLPQSFQVEIERNNVEIFPDFLGNCVG